MKMVIIGFTGIEEIGTAFDRRVYDQLIKARGRDPMGRFFV